MKKLGAVLLGLSVAMPLYAQDTAPATSPESTPPADQSAAPPPADQSAPPADQSATPPPADQSAAAPPADQSAAPPADQSAAAPPTDQSATPPADQSAAAPPADQNAAAPADQSATPPAEAATAAPAEGTPAETPPAEGTATVEAGATEEGAAPAESTEEKKPWIFYVGASYGTTKLSISNVSGFANKDTTNRTVQGRVGMRLTDGLGVEAHFGKGLEDDNTPGQARMDTYYGVYFVPTGILLDMVEFAFPLGFAWTKIEDADSSASLDGVSYGMNIEFPFKLITEAIPDIRLVGGGMVYQQNNSARTYGWHAGLRWDFAI